MPYPVVCILRARWGSVVLGQTYVYLFTSYLRPMCICLLVI